MTVQATVLIPTSDRSAALRFSLASVLRQTVADIEVFVVGNGVPPPTRELIADFTRTDPRVRFFDCPQVEPAFAVRYRHEALSEARGRVVCYLHECDLYLPHHVETMVGQLRQADFAQALHLDVAEDGRVHSWTTDLGLPQHRQRFLEGRGSMELFGVPLSGAAHTLEVYHRLADGWAGRPGDDQDLWRSLLRLPHCRVAASHRPSVLRFAGLLRDDWPVERCLPGLAGWSAKLEIPGVYTALLEELLRGKLAELARVQGERDLAWESYGETVGQLGLAYHQLREHREQLAPTRGKPEQAALHILGKLRRLSRLLRRYLPIGR